MWKRFRLWVVAWILWWRFLLRVLFGNVYIWQVLERPLIDYVQSVGQHFWVIETPVSIIWSGTVFDPDVALQKLEDTKMLLENNYMDPDTLDMQKMWDNAVRWYVEWVWDAYTVYLDPEQNKTFGEVLEWSQNFEGIGAVVSKKKDWIMIEEVLKESPAFKAGLNALDLVLKIDDTPTKDLDLYDGVDLIRGPSGTEVVVTILRSDDGIEPELLEITVIRWSIDVPSVEWEVFDIDGKRVLYIEMFTFGEDTADKLKEVIEWNEGNYDGVILDLRDNWGGILPISVEVASYWLPEWDVVSRIDYTAYPDMVLKSKWYATLEWLPTIVLVNKWSASASEIVAGALRDDSGARLLGETTFGKWSVQSIHPLKDWSSIKLSVGKRYTPNNINVNDDGLTPDIEVEFDTDTYETDNIDNQLERAKEELFK